MKTSIFKGALGIVLFLIGMVQAGDQGEPVEVARSYQIKSDILSQTRRINVYLPPGYAKGEKAYPVLFLMDGGVREDFLHIMGIATLAADFRNIREFIVVGVEGVDRYHDLLPPTTVKKEKKRWATAGGSADFRSFLGDELIPYVQDHFRITKERVLMGESAAGMFVVETFLKKPDLFSGYIAVSPSLWWDRQSLVKTAADTLKAGDFPKKRRIFLTIADEGGDMREGVDLLAAAMKGNKSLDWVYKPMDHESHGTIFHPAALEAVRWFFKIK